MGPSFSVELTPAGLRYASFDGAYTNRREVMIQPKPEDWEALWVALERANVWRWQSEYFQEAMDGTSWTLKVVWGGQKVESEGSNAYPDKSGEQVAFGQPYPAFERVLKAVSKLVGGRQFE